jgi:CubicO group peptidase (beta-lactamase class C family)
MTEETPRPSLSATTFVNPHRQPDGSGPAGAFAGVPATASSPLSSAPVDLDVEIVGAGTTMRLDDFLSRTYTTAFVVVVGGRVVHERYFLGATSTDLLLGASMSKSVLATLVGQAVTDGRLDIESPVTELVPELADSGYAACRVRHLLTMTTGLAWQEDYRTPRGDGLRLLAAVAPGGEGGRNLLGSVRGDVPPDTRWRYCTPDSLALDWARERATGEDHQTALAKLWATLRCESEALVGLDRSADGGSALAGMAVAATARDWARLGILQLDGGALLSPAWVRDSSAPSFPFTRPGRLPSDITTHAGYGYHWWPLDETGDLVMADGSRGQLTLVDRARRTVVVKTSTWPYDDWLVDRQNRDLSYLAMPEIARAAAELA